MRSPVTFLMPVRNGSDFLIDSLANIDAMADSGDEILVINDHSSDDTDEILHSMKSKMKNLVVLNNPSSGLVNALNFGLEEASNNLIARADVDDTYQIDRINKQINSFTSSTVAVFSDYTFVSPGKSNLGTIYSAVHPLAVSASLVSSQRTAHPSVVFSREAVIQVGGYRESDFPAEDLSLWLRLSRVGELRSVPLPLLNYRINPQGISATRRSEMLMKKTSLLSEISINKHDLNQMENSIPDILASYESISNDSERRILFARDLLTISKLGKKNIHLQKVSLAILRKELISGRLLPKTSKLLIEKLRRRQLR
jgi:glycosyltransferase involved in cell wall biosynthesis